MQSYYSILFVPLRPDIKEQVSIGLILRYERLVFFQYSKTKLNWLKDQLSTNSFRLLSHSIRAIDNLLKQESQSQKGTIYNLFPNEEKSSSSWNKEYISYLSKYNNNLLTFTPPRSISLKADLDFFKKLFQLYVSDDFEETLIQENKPDINSFLEEKFYPKIENRINKNIIITSQQVHTLFLPTQVDFIGQNKNPVLGRTVNFERRHDFVENDLRAIYTLVTAFEKIKENSGKYYVIGEEPKSKYNSKSHNVWREIYKSKIMDFVDYRDFEKIEEYLEKHDVRPFIAENDNIKSPPQI